MNRSGFVALLSDALGKDKETLGETLGVGAKQLSKLDARESWTPKQVVELAAKLIARTSESFVRPVVEFFPVYNETSRQGATQEIFTANDGDGNEHPWFKGLMAELKSCHGVYVFYDSRGRALYVGKADKQNLWAEMKNAYNRDREIQQIRTVSHPLARRREYSSSNEKERKITTKSVPLHCLTEYFSAYEIAPHAIDDLEALLIRSFANDLMNVRMETFSHQKAVRSRIGAE